VKFFRDLIERTAATYVEALAGLLMVSGVTHFSDLKAAAVAAVPAGLAVIKGVLASFVGNTNTAALLPKDSAPVRPV
jgi:hypothetical protein